MRSRPTSADVVAVRPSVAFMYPSSLPWYVNCPGSKDNRRSVAGAVHHS
jgi:hypothetical protein